MIDQELKQRALNPAAKDETAPREKILKLGKKITDVVEHKLGKLNASDAEYWGLAGVVTDEMADIALSMKLRTPYTVEELWRMNKVTDEQKPHFQELLDQMSYIGLLEYDYGYHYDHNGRTAPQSERRYILPMFVPASSEVSVAHLPSLVPQPLPSRAYAQALSLLGILLQEDRSQLITFKNNGGVQLLAILLRRCPPSHLSVELVTVIQQIVEALKVDDELYIAAVRYLLFDFSVWGSAPWFICSYQRRFDD